MGIRRQITKAIQLDESMELSCQQLADHELRKPTKPKLRRIMRHNATERAIMDALAGDGESIAFMSDEGALSHCRVDVVAASSQTLVEDRVNSGTLNCTGQSDSR